MDSMHPQTSDTFPTTDQAPPKIDWEAWKKELDPELVSTFEEAYKSAALHRVAWPCSLH